MHLWLFQASLNVGFTAAVSTRAFISSVFPVKPHFIGKTALCRLRFDAITGTISVGLISPQVFIGDSAFTLNEGFGRIELPKKLEKLGYHVFRGPKDNPLKQDVITIPEELLITEPFLDGILFEKYEVDEKNENHTAVDGLLMSKDGQTLVSVPTLKEGDLVIPDGTLYISYTALEGCDKITDIYLPDSILNIGNAGAKNYDTGEYYYVIHCSEGTEAQKLLDAKGIPWVAK